MIVQTGSQPGVGMSGAVFHHKALSFLGKSVLNPVMARVRHLESCAVRCTTASVLARCFRLVVAGDVPLAEQQMSQHIPAWFSSSCVCVVFFGNGEALVS